MCTNRQLVNSLECYMDDLVDSFEDFIKKSLIAISVGVGLLVGMLVYLLKAVNNTQAHLSTSVAALHTESRTKGLENAVDSLNDLKHPRKRNRLQEMVGVKNKGTSTPGTDLTILPSFDEKTIRDVGFTCCSRPGCSGLPPNSRSRLSNQTLPGSSIPMMTSQQKVNKRKSCCSMCCNEEYIQ